MDYIQTFSLTSKMHFRLNLSWQIPYLVIHGEKAASRPMLRKMDSPQRPITTMFWSNTCKKKCAFWAYFLPVLLALEIVLPVSRSLWDSSGGPHLPKGLGMLLVVQGISMSVQSNRKPIKLLFIQLQSVNAFSGNLHFLSIHGPSFNDPYIFYTEAAIRVKGSLELISMLIFQTFLKV